MNKPSSFITALVFLFTVFYSHFLFGQISELEVKLKNDPENKELLLKLGKYYHDLGGNQQNKKAVKKAEVYLSRLLDIKPENAVALVYYGSVLTMKARDAIFPWTKMKYIKKGFSRMDKAVFFESDNSEIRLIRGINSVSVPDRFHQLSIALEDFKHIEALHQNQRLNMTNKFWLPYYYNYGLALMKSNALNGAKEKFIKVVEIAPESDYGQKARKKLASMRDES